MFSQFTILRTFFTMISMFSKGLEPRISVWYGLPKIHKCFYDFPPFRAIVSSAGFWTYGLSEFINSFLKYQPQRCNSYVKDTKDFLNKIRALRKLPKFFFLVSMDTYMYFHGSHICIPFKKPFCVHKKQRYHRGSQMSIQNLLCVKKICIEHLPIRGGIN